MTRKICVALTTRGNYAKMKSTMRAIREEPALELQRQSHVAQGGACLRRQVGE